MSQVVPDELVDLALEHLDAEVKRWRRVPWAPGHIRLLRYSLCVDDIGPAEEPQSQETITCHDVPAHMADDMIVRFAMEKAVEAVIGAISVATPAKPKRKTPRKRKAKS
ncbi:hypothetical protein [Bradyrhizobium sp. th.b2]|uniref:hypothetical protein n=1 Tax=Bradyrhizobium sp. th-b2 TaxID=172088 RepID=UPI0004073C32|nr:hypothetical protein [Bradyrhizobium sp. th.b2]